MKFAFVFSALLVFSSISCKKNHSPGSINGIYIENKPVAGRSQLNFTRGNLVIKSETGSSSKDTFTYSISAGKIKLTPRWTNLYQGQEFDFDIIDNNTIEIGYLYPGIPEMPLSNMLYKK